MLVYTGTKQSFMADVRSGRIADIVRDKVLEKLHRNTAESEFRSWDNSMWRMYVALNADEIPWNCGVAIEYNVPLTSKRVDFILTGYDADGSEHANIIELKQWSDAQAVDGLDGVIVRTPLGGGIRETTHPSYQAWSYADHMYKFSACVQDKNIRLHPCAFAHNYIVNPGFGLADNRYADHLNRAPLFGKYNIDLLQEFLSRHIKAGDDQAVLADLGDTALRPSKSLQDSLVSMLEGNDEFTLLDSQKVFFEQALAWAREAKRTKTKQVYIVEGGPGTGKSVIAVSLLARLIAEGQLVAYVSKNSAPRNVYGTKLAGRRKKKEIDALFKGPKAFIEVGQDSFDTLLVDEAHRLVANDRFSKQSESQIKEVIKAARCSIFFIDESQRVSVDDIGSVAEIERWAARLGAEVHRSVLESQFRCNGSDGYLAWLDDVLEIRHTANQSLEGIDFDFRVFDTPAELEQAIRAKNGRNKARLVAGYCWDWPKRTQADPEYHDITIGDWGMSWNLGNTSTYAIDERSIDEVGCIHTVQGLEFDYVGVIIGPDMRLEDGYVATDLFSRSSQDTTISGLKGRHKTDPAGAERTADEIIRNTYRTLMTRGMKGCYIYCCDEALGEYFRKRLGIK